MANDSHDGFLCTLQLTLMVLLGLTHSFDDLSGCCGRVKALGTTSDHRYGEPLLELCASSVDSWLAGEPFAVDQSEWSLWRAGPADTGIEV